MSDRRKPSGQSFRAPKSLKALTASWVDEAPGIKEHGCPVGSLACELSEDDKALSADGARMMREILDWMERQFRELGRRDAAALAVTMLAAIQGAALLANTLRDEDLLHREIRGRRASASRSPPESRRT